MKIQRDDIPQPYKNEKCQIELYNTLIKLITNHHFDSPPPIHYAINLLSKGQSNSNMKISQICSNGLSYLNSFVHPSCSSLSFPIEMEENKINSKGNSSNEVEIILNSNDENSNELEDNHSDTNIENTENGNDIINDKFKSQKESTSNNDTCDIKNDSNNMSLDDDEENDTNYDIHSKRDSAVILDITESKNEESESIETEKQKVDTYSVYKKPVVLEADDEIMEKLEIEESPVKTLEEECKEISIDEQEICNYFVDIINE